MSCRPRKYRRNPLEAEIYCQGFLLAEVGKAIGHSGSYVAERLNGTKSWTVREGIAILELLNIPIERFDEFFLPRPKKGKHGRKD